MCPAQRRAISIHALREEGDRVRANSQSSRSSFLSTPSARRATLFSFFFARIRKISIHALREEGDLYQLSALSSARTDFYPRPPRGGRRDRRNVSNADKYFYPRPPRGGRPVPSSAPCDRLSNFYPRPPRGGRPNGKHAQIPRYYISIHALREEGDVVIRMIALVSTLFLSTPSARRATVTSPDSRLQIPISIHALREEGDRRSKGGGQSGQNFYPRPPRGGRHGFIIGLAVVRVISIHALREEGDMHLWDCTKIQTYFYPRPPRGGRLLLLLLCALLHDFYPRPPRGGRRASDE